MRLYRFKTFNSTYFFPTLTKKNRFIYSLYGNYGGKAAHIIWWAFTHVWLFRWMNRVSTSQVEGYEQLRRLIGEGYVFGINMGTNGPDQKKSILGYEISGGKTFFAKLATSERAMALSKNEIKVYKALEGSGLVPELYDYKTTDEYVFLKCECINGKHVHGQIEDEQIMKILLSLKEKHYHDNRESSTLTTCFAHMDFCPWNMIEDDGRLRVIDWEMANEMPLGFDLFTYLLQTHFLTEDKLTGKEIIEKNKVLLQQYFQQERNDWMPYLEAFLKWKIDFFSKGQNNHLLQRFKETLTEIA